MDVTGIEPATPCLQSARFCPLMPELQNLRAYVDSSPNEEYYPRS